MSTMFNTSVMCRQQEAHHRQIAAETPLANVRRIALKAAAAWEIQAEEAAGQEIGATTELSAEDAAIALEFLLEGDELEKASDPEPTTLHTPTASRASEQGASI